MTLRVGLTGGIGAGKSTVSRLLADLGAVIIDYDLLAREVVEPGSPALATIAERFGPEVIDATGGLDRPALGAIVFADPSARQALEAITHPAIHDLAAAREASAAPDAVVVHDNPLLVEMGAHTACEVVIVVDVPVEVQVQRLVEARGMSAEDARARIAAQTTRETRASVADHVIDNSGTETDLVHAVQTLWASLTR